MTLNNSSNQQYSNNADGFALGGGTTVRTLTLSGGNLPIALTTLASGNLLQYNGTNFVNVPQAVTPRLINTAGTLDLAASGVTAGTYTLSTTAVDTYGRVTSASSTTIGTGLQYTTGTLAMSTSGVSAGTYNGGTLVVDALGRITTISNMNLDNLLDVVISSVSTSDKLIYNGTNWVNGFSSTQTSTGASTTTSTSYQNKISYTTPSLPSGNYKISWFFIYGYSNVSRSFNGRVTVGGSSVADVSSPAFSGLFTGGTVANISSSGFVYRSLSGVQTIAVQYASSNTADTATISNAHLMVERVN